VNQAGPSASQTSTAGRARLKISSYRNDGWNAPNLRSAAGIPDRSRAAGHDHAASLRAPGGGDGVGSMGQSGHLRPGTPR
jgi:hypothetical protein